MLSKLVKAFCLTLLGDIKFNQSTGLIKDRLGCQNVDTARKQPLVTKDLDVELRIGRQSDVGLSNGIDKICEDCVAPGMPGEIELQTFLDGLLTDEFIKLLQERGPFSIADPIELSIISFSYIGYDGVDPGATVDLDTFKLPLYDFMFVLGTELSSEWTMLHGKERHGCSETFVEPEIIPPSHRHEVTKPLMSQLMKDDIDELHFRSFCRRGTTLQIVFIKGNTADVLHRVRCVLLKYHLVILLVESERASEEFSVKLDTLLTEVYHLHEVVVLEDVSSAIYSH